MAQGGGGAGGGGRRGGGQPGQGGNPYGALTLLNRADVQKDLAVTDDQKTKLGEIRTASRQKMQDAMQGVDRQDRAAMTAAMGKVNDEISKEALAVLTGDQPKRLKEITVQIAGPRAATIKDVQAELGLSDDQKKAITDLMAKQQLANREIGQKVQDGSLDQAGARDARTKNDKVLGDEIEKVLTDAQKAKLKDMAGTKKFVADPPAARGGGGAGGNRRRGGGF